MAVNKVFWEDPYLKSNHAKITAIVSEFSDEEQKLRYWQVEGFAKVACGGTHIMKYHDPS